MKNLRMLLSLGTVFVVLSLSLPQSAAGQGIRRRTFGYVIAARTVGSNLVQTRFYPVVAYEGGQYTAARIWGPEQIVQARRSNSVLNHVRKFDLYDHGLLIGGLDVLALDVPPHPCWTELFGNGKASWYRPLDFSRGTRGVVDKAEAILLRFIATNGLAARDFRVIQPYQPSRDETLVLIRLAQAELDRFRREMEQSSVTITPTGSPGLIRVQSLDVEQDGTLEIVADLTIPITPVDVGDFRWTDLFLSIVSRRGAIASPLAVLPPSQIPSRVEAIDLQGNGRADLFFHSEDDLLYTIYSLQGGKFIPVLKEDPRYYC